jgi:hypothetical protein
MRQPQQAPGDLLTLDRGGSTAEDRLVDFLNLNPDWVAADR